MSPLSPALQVDSLPAEPSGKPCAIREAQGVGGGCYTRLLALPPELWIQ